MRWLAAAKLRPLDGLTIEVSSHCGDLCPGIYQAIMLCGGTPIESRGLQHQADESGRLQHYLTAVQGVSDETREDYRSRRGIVLYTQDDLRTLLKLLQEAIGD